MNESILVETIYLLVILISCFLVAKHTRCLYKLSLHQGIHSFEQAFIYWGLGFFFRYLTIFGETYPSFAGITSNTLITLTNILYEFFVCLGGFFLVYSLIWRQLEQTTSGVFAIKHGGIVMHALALAIALVDISLETFHVMFIVQIIALGFAGLLAFDHWRANKKPLAANFTSLYVVALVAAIASYVINYTAIFLIPNHPWVKITTYLLTASLFVLITFGVMRIVHSSAYCEKCCACISELSHAHTHISTKSKKKNGKKTRKA